MQPLNHYPQSSRPEYGPQRDSHPLPGHRWQDAPPTSPPRPGVQNGFVLGRQQASLPNGPPVPNPAIAPSIAAAAATKAPYITVEGWPAEPRDVGKAGKSTLIWRLIDVIMIAIPVLIIIMAIFARLADGNVVLDHPSYRKIIDVTSIAVSVYPIVFAAVVGRTLDAIACWRVERGARIQVLEQILGSTTVYNTVNVHLRLRAFNFIAVALFIVWSLSPIGGQGILRLISIEERFTTVTSPLGYANTAATNGGSVFFDEKGTGVQLPAMNAVYRASIIATNATMSAPQDTWGNIKVPRIEALDQNSKDSAGWIAIPQRNVAYSSLVSIPSVGVAQVGNSSFNMESTYYDLTCEEPVQIPSIDEVHWQSQPNIKPGVGSIRFPNSTRSSTFDSTFSLGTFTPYKNRFTSLLNGQGGDTSKNDDSPRNINIQSVTGNIDSWRISTTNCTIKTSNVELAVKCIAQNCSVSAIRRSNKRSDLPENYTPFENSQFAYFFFEYLTQATGVVSGLSPFWYSTLSENYVAFESNPLSNPNRSQVIDMSKLGAEELSIRWGRLLNTYFLISSVPLAITGEYAQYTFAQYSNLASNLIPFNAVQSSAGVKTSQQIYRTHLTFFILTLVSASVLLFCAVLGPWLKFINIAPDLVGHISSVTRDSPYFRLPPGGSALGGYERARLLKDVEIMAGDVTPATAAIGRIAFAPVTGPGSGRRVQKGRRYT